MKIDITQKEIDAIQNAWKLVRNEMTGGTNEEGMQLRIKMESILDGLRSLMDKTKNV
jgi:hypothetical protein